MSPLPVVVREIWGCLDSQHAFAAADPGGAGAHGLEDHAGLDRLQERVELGAGAGQLDRVALVGDVEDAAAEDVGEALHLVAILAGRAHLHEHQLALDVVPFGEVDDLHDVDELVQLLRDLLDHVVGAGGDAGHPRHRHVLGRRNGQRFDVVAARGEESRDAGERARFVLDEDGKDVAHQSSSARIISVRPLPPGTIGNTFSFWSVMKSRNTSRSFCANASRSAPSTSPGFSILIPTCPYASASFTKSGSASMYDSA